MKFIKMIGFHGPVNPGTGDTSGAVEVEIYLVPANITSFHKHPNFENVVVVHFLGGYSPQHVKATIDQFVWEAQK